MGLSNYQKVKQAEAFRDGNPLFVSFWSEAPNAAFSEGVELTQVGYGRIEVANNSTNFDINSTGLWKNKNVLRTANNAGENWPPIVAIGYHDDLSAGNPKAYHVLTTPLSVYSGNPAEIPAEAAKIQF